MYIYRKRVIERGCACTSAQNHPAQWSSDYLPASYSGSSDLKQNYPDFFAVFLSLFRQTMERLGHSSLHSHTNYLLKRLNFIVAAE